MLLDCRRLACRARDVLNFQGRPCWMRDASNPAGGNPARDNPARDNPATARRSYWIAGVSPVEHGTCSIFKAGLAGCETHPIQQETNPAGGNPARDNPARGNPARDNPATARRSYWIAGVSPAEHGTCSIFKAGLAGCETHPNPAIQPIQ